MGQGEEGQCTRGVQTAGLCLGLTMKSLWLKLDRPFQAYMDLETVLSPCIASNFPVQDQLFRVS